MIETKEKTPEIKKTRRKDNDTNYAEKVKKHKETKEKNAGN
jgi:hypothetical protein